MRRLPPRSPLFPYTTLFRSVRTAFLKDHADVVERLLEGHVAATAFLNQSPAEARTLVNQGIAKLTGKSLPAPVIDTAWTNLVFTDRKSTRLNSSHVATSYAV